MTWLYCKSSSADIISQKNQFSSDATEPKTLFICKKILSVDPKLACQESIKFVGFLTLIFAHLFAVVQPCLFSVNGSSGFISSSGAKNYNRCTWIVTVPSNHTVKLKFTIFRLADDPWLPSKDRWLGQAKIQVHDGKGKNDTVLGIFTGARQPFIIQTSGRFMMFTLQKEYSLTPCNFKGTFISSRKGKRK